MKHIFLIIFTSFLITTSLWSENVRYKFCYYGKNEGLSQHFITCIGQDDRGFIWIGTGEGLYKFDGINFVKYDTDNFLDYNFVSSCTKDSLGRMWFGNSGSVTMNDHGVFKNLKTPNSGLISDMFVDQGKVWLATQSDGFTIVNEDLSMTEVESPLPNRNVLCSYPIGYDRCLFGTNQGLFVAQLNKKSYHWSVPYAYQETEDMYVKKIIPYTPDPNFLLIITESQLFTFNVITNRINKLELPESFVEQRMISSVNDGLFDSDGSLWFTTYGNGVVQLHPYEELKFNDFSSYSMKTGLKTETDNAKIIFQDQDGNVWFGLSDKGLTRIIDNNLSLFSYEELGKRNNFTSLTKSDKSIWVGAYGAILHVENESGKIISMISTDDGLPEDKISSLYLQGEDQLWIGTESSGLFFLDLKTKLLYQKEISLDNLENSINCITGKGDDIWIATGGGLFRMNLKSLEETWYRSEDSYVFHNIEHLFVDSQERLFISFKGSTVTYLDKNMQPQDLLGRKTNNYWIVKTITEDINHNVWIATIGNGLIKVVGDSIVNYNQSSGLFSDFCYSLFAHGQAVYVGHQGAVSKLDIVSQSIDVIDESQGIPEGTNFNTNAIIEDASANLWFGTTKGLLRIKNEKQARKSVAPPKINILSVKINDEAVDFTKRIVLGHGEYNIEFNYIGIKHNNPLKVKYRYKLEGYDQKWSDFDDKCSKSYPKTGYGKYEFKLRAYNEHYSGAALETPIRILIKKPFYLKAWFYLLSIFVLVGSVYAIIKYRERNLRKIQTNLMKKLNEKTRDIIVKEEIIKERRKSEGELIDAKNRAEESNMLKSALLANLSHEIRTPLNAIVGFSNLLNDPDLDESEREAYAQVITKNSDNLLGLIEDIVDLSQIESKQIKPRMSICYIYNVLNDVYHKNIEKAAEYCGDKVAYKLQPMEPLKDKKIQADSGRLEQILDKLIDNALKFTSEGQVEIGYALQNGDVEIFVKDTGIGISPEQMQYIFEAFRRVEGQKEVLYGGAGIGLTLADKLGHLMNMELNVKSELEKGSTFTLKIPVVN